MADFKITLEAARVNAHLTQTQAAEKIGVSKSTILAWENGERYPNMQKLAMLCDAYGAPMSVIFLPNSTT